MKVAILTFINTPNNCGAVLQAWALSKAIEMMGHEAVLVNYWRERGDLTPWWSFKSLRGIYYTAKYSLWESLRLRRYHEFRTRHLNLTKPIYGGRIADVEADAFITGSDQVFNPIHNEGNADFFLDFAPECKRRIAYGASFGTNDFSVEYVEMMKDLLPRFKALSVREEDGAGLIEKIAGRKADLVCDPTLLVDAKEYIPLMSRGGDLDKTDKYVFVYLIGTHHDALRLARQKAREIGARRIFVMKNGRAEWHWPQTGLLRRLYVFSPADFLCLVSHAAYVVTNSFHGTVFSVIFKRHFESLRNGNSGDSRMETLMANVEKHGIDSYRKESLRFLEEALR